MKCTTFYKAIILKCYI